MADFAIINGTDAELTNVNAGGSDVAARSVSAAVTLTNAEVFAILDQSGDNSIAVMNASPSTAEKMDVVGVLLDEILTDHDLSTAEGRIAFRLKGGLEEYKTILSNVGQA